MLRGQKSITYNGNSSVQIPNHGADVAIVVNSGIDRLSQKASLQKASS